MSQPLARARLLLLTLVGACTVVGLAAQPPRPAPLTVDGIMRGPALVGYPPSALRWSGDGRDLYFEWRRPGDPESSTWIVAAPGGEPRKLTDDERRSAPPAFGTWDAARRRVIAVQDGDIVLIDTVARTRTVITRTAGAESAPRWARGETHVTFIRDNGVFIVPVAAADRGVIVQLSEAGPKRPDPKPTDAQAFLKDEEQALIAFTREAAERRKRAEERRKAMALPRFELQERQSIVDAVLTADEKHLVLTVSERPQNAKNADVPNYVTESAYSEMIPTRSKVGDAQETRRLAVLDLGKAESAWLDLATAYAEGVKAPAPAGPTVDAQASETPAATLARLKGQTLRWGTPVVSRNGAVLVTSVRSTDNEDRWLVRLDPVARTVRVIDHLRDSAWVREGFGPGGAGVGFLANDRDIYFTSERTGWNHLYVVDATSDAPAPRALTEGPWEVQGVDLSVDRSTFYLSSNEADLGERHLYALPATGGARTRLTLARGGHEGEVSPDGARIALISSSANVPPELFVRPIAADAPAVRVTTSPSAEWATMATWVEPTVIRITARDGVQVPARLYTPEMVGARRDPRRPGVVFVHGAGYLQNAHRYWSTYYREYMFHHLMAQRGYVVLDVDYRASAGYGRDWRTAIFRHMGGKDLDDIVDAAKYMVDKERVDASRIGVYGGSYGGFITLMAMFTAPDTFAAGAALRPVTDWAHYNHGYTSGILNEPQKDAEAYRRSSPIYFADKLKGALLICHGIVDTNVHVQDSIRLAQRLIELRKEDWELALYPVENHGFEQESSWADEYKRILKLFETNLRRRERSLR